MRNEIRVIGMLVGGCVFSCASNAFAVAPLPSAAASTSTSASASVSSELLRGPRPADPRPQPSVVPSSSAEPSEWVSYFSVYAGCELDPAEIVVSAADSDDCASIHPTPAMDVDGDTSEVAANLTWSVDDPAILALQVQNGGKLVSLATHQDFFDAESGEEPSTIVRFCATNACPSTPSSCQSQVCGNVRVTATVSVSGAWMLNGAPVLFTQSGRTFRSADGAITAGVVLRDAVSFQWNGRSAHGVIDPTRRSMRGQLVNLDGSDAGAWVAVR